MRKVLVFGNPAIEEAEVAEVVATLRSGWIGTYPRVARFCVDREPRPGSTEERPSPTFLGLPVFIYYVGEKAAD